MDTWAWDPGENVQVYCNGSGYGDLCFLETNDSQAQAVSIHQNVPLGPLQGHSYQLCMQLRVGGTTPATVQLVVWLRGGTIPQQSAQQTTTLTSSSWQPLCTFAYTQVSGHTQLYGQLIMQTSNVNVDVDQVT